MEQLLDAAVVENIGNQATNTDNHDLVDAPVGNIPDISAVENIDNQSNNNDNRDVVDAPVGNLTDRLLNVDSHHVANVDPQEPVHFPPDIPGDGRQHLLPRRLPTRPALTRTQQCDDYVLLRQIESERLRAKQRAQQRANDVMDPPVCNSEEGAEGSSSESTYSSSSGSSSDSSDSSSDSSDSSSDSSDSSWKGRSWVVSTRN